MTTDHPALGAARPQAAPARPVPRALAGPGLPETVLKVLDEAGWHQHYDEAGNVHTWSPDGRVHVGFVPEGDPDVTWQVDAHLERNASDGPVWAASFGPNTPAELVAAFVATLLDPGPFTRDPGDPSTMLHEADRTG